MSQLGDKQIKDSFPGIIKTSDEGAIGSTPKRLQDGTGQNLPVDVTTTAMRYFGTQDFTNATVVGIAGGGGTSGTSGVNGAQGAQGAPGTSGTDGSSGISPAGGATNYFGSYPNNPYTQGYGPTYANTTYPIHGECFWSQAIDQNDWTVIMSRFTPEVGVGITNFVVPVFNDAAVVNYHLYVYDSYPNTGAPRDQIFTVSFQTPGLLGDIYINIPVTFTPTSGNLWYGVQYENGISVGGSSRAGTLNRNNITANYYTYGAWGASAVGILAVNSLYYNGDPQTAPLTLLENQQYGHRDEPLVHLYHNEYQQ